VEALAGAVPDRYRALIVFPAGMGLRQGECFGLSVDRESTSCVGRFALTASSSPPATASPSSDPEEQGRVPHRAHARGGGLDPLRSPGRYRPGRFALVFTNTWCNPLRRSTVGQMWHRARKQAGLPEWATFHDLRHFYASLLIAKGCSVKAVQRRLGHQSAMETLDTYGHLWPNSDDETRAAVDEVLAGVTGVESCRRPPLATSTG
jgi:hypothetical protein